MENLIATSERLVSSLKRELRRYLYHEIDWSDRLIEITGSRGVGKTTLMLQRIHEISHISSDLSLYVSLDDPYFFRETITSTADEFIRHGGKFLFLDEVHKYPAKYNHLDWSAEIKVIYDKYPDLHIIYSGSSILKLYKGQGDLSRRRSSYNLKGFSFREFLKFEGIMDIDAFTLDDLIIKHPAISKEILAHGKIFPYFKNYLANGYYPFYQESPTKYKERLRDVLTVILESDIPSVTEITYFSIQKIKKLLSVIGSSVPYTPNLTKLRTDLQISDHRTLLGYLTFLEKAEVLGILNKNVTGSRILNKPDKVYLNNTNLFEVLELSGIETGTIRETFFFNQVSTVASIKYPENGDFIINDHYTFEIGGKNKSNEQIKDLANAYLVLDDIEIGMGNRIPLWLFGFLY